MKRMQVPMKQMMKTAVLAGVLSMAFICPQPAVQAEGGYVDEFAQRVNQELNSNSTFMQQVRQYVSEAQAAHENGTSYDDFQTNNESRFSELAGTTALTNITYSLNDDNDAQAAMTWGAVGRLKDEGDSRYTGITGSIDTTHRQTAIYHGRITPGDSSILGNQTVTGSQSIETDQTVGGNQTVEGNQLVAGNSAIGGNQTIDGHLWVGNGIDANNHKITNVADGEISPTSQDAVNGRQLYHVNRRIDHLRNRVNRIGAGAAALAALQPLPFSPDQKWSIAAGYGHYQDANATALGAYYYPNENIMVSMGTAFGNGENMVNAGLSLRLGPSGQKAKSTAMAGEIEELKALVHEQGQQIQEQGKQIEELKAQNAMLMEKLSK